MSINERIAEELKRQGVRAVFTLMSEDTARLIVEVDLRDNDFFKQPFARATLEFAPSDLKIEPFNCSPEGVTGTVRKEGERLVAGPGGPDPGRR